MHVSLSICSPARISDSLFLSAPRRRWQPCGFLSSMTARTLSPNVNRFTRPTRHASDVAVK